MPLPAVWGPIAWKLLHAIGAKAGNPSIPSLRADEQRQIQWLIQHVEYIIPCNECRQHIKTYRKTVGIPDSSSFATWLWTFHEAVNERLGKPGGPPFTVDLGKDIDILKTWKDYIECVKESYQLGHLRSEDVKEWKRHLLLWKATV